MLAVCSLKRSCIYRDTHVSTKSLKKPNLAHSVDRGWEVSTARRRQPTARACLRHGYLSGPIGWARRESLATPLQPPAGCGSPFGAGFAIVARLRTKGANRSMGCRDMRMLRRSYYWSDCGSRVIDEFTGDNLRVTRCA